MVFKFMRHNLTLEIQTNHFSFMQSQYEVTMPEQSQGNPRKFLWFPLDRQLLWRNRFKAKTRHKAARVVVNWYHAVANVSDHESNASGLVSSFVP